MTWPQRPTLVAHTPAPDASLAWERLGTALLDAIDVGYRDLQLVIDRHDHARVAALLGPIAHTRTRVQVVIRASAAAGVDTRAWPRHPTWLVAAAGDDRPTPEVTAELREALASLAAAGLHHGISVDLTAARADDLEHLAEFARAQQCKTLAIRTMPRGAVDAADALQLARAYIAARRLAARGHAALAIEFDLREREQVVRHFAPGWTTAAALTRLVPVLVVGADGRVDPLRAGMPGFSLGTLAEGTLLELLAHWRARHGGRWVALCRATLASVGCANAWPIVDWPDELAACAARGAESDARCAVR